jgi:hypothetical protein
MTFVPSSGTCHASRCAALPVERALERVLHGQGAALDEEQVRQCRIAKHPGKDIDEVGR